jgi:hypothetical protein
VNDEDDRGAKQGHPGIESESSTTPFAPYEEHMMLKDAA